MNDRIFKWGVYLIVFICVAYGAYVWYWWDASMESKGQLGDSFGAVTSLFTVLTFFYFVHTVSLQQEQMDLQKKGFNLQLVELTLTREELAKQSNAQQQSEAALREQIEKQVLSTLLNSYVSRFNTLMSFDLRNPVHAGLYPLQEVREEIHALKIAIKKLENKLEYQNLLSDFNKEHHEE